MRNKKREIDQVDVYQGVNVKYSWGSIHNKGTAVFMDAIRTKSKESHNVEIHNKLDELLYNISYNNMEGIQNFIKGEFMKVLKMYLISIIDEVIVHQVLNQLASSFEQLNVNCTTQKKNCYIDDLIVICIQKERLTCIKLKVQP